MTRPRLRTGGNLLPGLAAVALFVVFAAGFVTAGFDSPAGFGENAAVMHSLGAALISIDAGAIVGEATPVPAEGFVASLIIVAVALDAALDGSLMLARREEAGENVTVGTESGEPTETVADGGTQEMGGGDD